jgi:glutamate synthase domain-containing protein 3
LRNLVERHAALTESPHARQLLDHWEDSLQRFILVFPHELKRVLGVPRSQTVYSGKPILSQAASVQEVKRG